MAGGRGFRVLGQWIIAGCQSHTITPQKTVCVIDGKGKNTPLDTIPCIYGPILPFSGVFFSGGNVVMSRLFLEAENFISGKTSSLQF